MEAFKRLARKHDVESNVIGEFTNDGKFDVVYGEKQVAYMDMSFVHENVPQKSLSAKWSTPEQRGLREPELPGIENYGSFLKNMLARPNIASIEYIFRQYDHEVQGGSVIKPFVGRDSDASSDASVSRPLLKSNRGVALADGLAAEYNQIDPYHGTLCALDETIRRVVAVGANPKKIALNDNFCWPSPLPSKNNPDADYKTAQLVRANEALYEGTTKLKVPCVSGKDSMSMDGTVMDADGKERRISALPTLKFAADGIVTDVRKCVTMDAKCPGDLVYMLGMTRDELGGSEFYSMHSEVGLNVPKVDLKKSRLLYNVVYSAMNRGIIASCHGCYKGGLGIALAQTAFAGGYGMDVSLSAVPKEGLDNDAKLLFSESAGRFVVTVPQDKQEQFEKVMRGRRKTGSAVDYGVVGKVTNNSYLKVTGLGGNAIINESIGDLKQAWKGTYANR
jgi:phosphoribosylformylglycinamidine synthase